MIGIVPIVDAFVEGSDDGKRHGHLNPERGWLSPVCPFGCGRSRGECQGEGQSHAKNERGSGAARGFQRHSLHQLRCRTNLWWLQERTMDMSKHDAGKAALERTKRPKI